MESSLELVSDWGSKNLVAFNTSGIDTSVRIHYKKSLRFQGIPLSTFTSTGNLGVKISKEVQYGGRLEVK